jgi:hypothetical protein
MKLNTDNAKITPADASYPSGKGTPDVAAAKKVADLTSKTSDGSTGKAQNLGTFGDHNLVK